MTASVGDYLKQARESQGLTLEQAALLTRIQQPFLRALEEENFSELPEQVFTKGFVRTYARSLKADEGEALRRFSEAASSYYSQGEEDRRKVLKQIEDERRGKLNRNVVMVVTGALLIGLVYVLPLQQSGPSSSHTADQTKSSPVPSRQTTVSKHDVSGSRVARDAQGSVASGSNRLSSTVESGNQSRQVIATPNSAGSESQAHGDLVLELQAAEITWIIVQSDEGEPREALLREGETARWRAAERFFLTLGNAGGVSVKLNGIPQGPFGESGVVVRDLEIKP